MLAVTREYANGRIRVDKLVDDIEEYFENEGYETQRADKDHWHIIQARKGGILRDLFAGDRAFTVLITEEKDKVKIAVGVGKWLQNLTVSLVEGILLTPLLLFVEIPISLWSYEIEGKLWRFIDRQVELRTASIPG